MTEICLTREVREAVMLVLLDWISLSVFYYVCCSRLGLLLGHVYAGPWSFFKLCPADLAPTNTNSYKDALLYIAFSCIWLFLPVQICFSFQCITSFLLYIVLTNTNSFIWSGTKSVDCLNFVQIYYANVYWLTGYLVNGTWIKPFSFEVGGTLKYKTTDDVSFFKIKHEQCGTTSISNYFLYGKLADTRSHTKFKIGTGSNPKSPIESVSSSQIKAMMRIRMPTWGRSYDMMMNRSLYSKASTKNIAHLIL